MPPEPPSIHNAKPSTGRPAWQTWAIRGLAWAVGLTAAGAVSVLMLVALALATAYPNLPDISELADYRPKLPLRVFTADGVLIGEFGEERRNLTTIAEIPKVMKDAVLAIEDARFYEHSGVDYVGVVRAGLANVAQARSQGASTITMQVARNVYLTFDKTFTRKIYEILLTFKLEHLLTKDQILEIYMNQIFLGNRAYGFAAAAETYFGKPLQEVTIAEAAMLAGLPKAPSAYNPISNPRRARIRQLHIIDRMLANDFITEEQAAAARIEPLRLRAQQDKSKVHAEHVAEMARQLMFAQYGEDLYSRGLNVYTTILAEDQTAAYRALRLGIMDFERRQVYRGPERFVELPADKAQADQLIDDVLVEHPDNDDLLAAVVLEADAQRVLVVRQDAQTLEIKGEGLRPVQSGLASKAAPNKKIRRGAVVRIYQLPNGSWTITQKPEVEGALVSLDPRTGALRSLVGGFDFDSNKFNNVTQAWRQPGSSFKPFIYSAALEVGVTSATVVNDAPLFFTAEQTGGQAWEPKNYDATFDGPMSVRRALARSKNMVSIRVLQTVGPQAAQDWVARFGFEPERHPPYLTMALGAGSVTPMQLATGYSVFANGGYRVNPWLITRVSDQKGKTLLEVTPPEIGEGVRAIDARNAFVMSTLLQEITRSGTAARAQGTLKRPDLYGKTGTTNDSMDAWFAGFQPTVTAVAWMGYSNPRKLGDRETGGGLSLPIWINYMAHVLKGVPVQEVSPTEGVVSSGGEWFYEEYARGGGISSLGLEDPAARPEGAASAPASSEERRGILDLFRN